MAWSTRPARLTTNSSHSRDVVDLSISTEWEAVVRQWCRLVVVTCYIP